MEGGVAETCRLMPFRMGWSPILACRSLISNSTSLALAMSVFLEYPSAPLLLAITGAAHGVAGCDCNGDGLGGALAMGGGASAGATAGGLPKEYSNCPRGPGAVCSAGARACPTAEHGIRKHNSPDQQESAE